jgi:hypothetical protein
LRKFFLIFGRNALFLRRNPRIILAIFINSIYFGLVLVAVFFHVGIRTVDSNGVWQSIDVWIGNWVGIAQILSNNITFTSCLTVVL